MDCSDDITAGQGLWSTKTCFVCHGNEASIPTDGSTVWTGLYPIDLFDSAGDGYETADGNLVFLDLPEYLSIYMPNTAGPVTLQEAEQITAFLTSKVGYPWCPGEAWPPATAP